MKGFAEYASRSLGIKLPEDYTSFMETYGKKLPEDPIGEKGWIRGLGSPEFVIGTTLAFRSTLPGFSSRKSGDWLYGYQDDHSQQNVRGYRRVLGAGCRGWEHPDH